jgi:hypothetical protein
MARLTDIYWTLMGPDLELKWLLGKKVIRFSRSTGNHIFVQVDFIGCDLLLGEMMNRKVVRESVIDYDTQTTSTCVVFPDFCRSNRSAATVFKRLMRLNVLTRNAQSTWEFVKHVKRSKGFYLLHLRALFLRLFVFFFFPSPRNVLCCVLSFIPRSCTTQPVGVVLILLRHADDQMRKKVWKMFQLFVLIKCNESTHFG